MPNEMVTVTGIVDGLNIPKEWKPGKFGLFKMCGILLKECNKEGITWINYFWNEKDKAGHTLANPFEGLEKGKRYDFACKTSVYNEKIQYTPVSFFLAGGQSAPQHTPEEVEPPTQEEKPSNMAPTMGKFVAVENYEGKNYLVVLAENGATIWVTC